MKRKLVTIVLALVVAVLLWVRLAKKNIQEGGCLDFETMEAVEVIAGSNQGVTGLVLHVANSDTGTCLYKVRGQRGVEMPFVEWYESWELVLAYEG